MGLEDSVSNIFKPSCPVYSVARRLLVEKVLIDQASLRDLLNTLLPGSYDSVSRINFKALDDVRSALYSR